MNTKNQKKHNVDLTSENFVDPLSQVNSNEKPFSCFLSILNSPQPIPLDFAISSYKVLCLIHP